MSDISTLVQDIENLFEGHSLEEVAVDRFSRGLADEFALRFEDYRKDRKPSLRLSNYGKPLRQLWYELKSYPREKLSASVKFKLLYGNILESVLLLLASEAGHSVTDQQRPVEVDGVLGHLDAVIDGVVVDVKSASTYNFKRFQSGGIRLDDPFGYIPQLSAYSRGLGGVDGAFLVVDKTLGHIHLERFSKEELESYNPSHRIADVRLMLEQKDAPERCYEPVPVSKTDRSGNLVLSTPCSYCGFKTECWKDANDGAGLKTYNYASGVKFFVKINKEPRVEAV